MIWDGYPHSVSILGYSGITRKVDHDGISAYNLSCDYPIIYGCEGVYIKWLNRLGGYSYWLFNSEFKDSYNAKSLGVTENNYDSRLTALSRVNSRGYAVDKSKKLLAKFDKSYMAELETLVGSPEIYLYTAPKGSGQNEWTKVDIKGGSFNGIDNKHNTVEFGITIELPEIYTQTR